MDISFLLAYALKHSMSNMPSAHHGVVIKKSPDHYTWIVISLQVKRKQQKQRIVVTPYCHFLQAQKRHDTKRYISMCRQGY